MKQQVGYPNLDQRWTDLLASAGIPERRSDVKTTNDRGLLRFADGIYPLDATFRLEPHSVLSGEYHNFHHITRREISHYLEEVGQRMESDVSFRRWVWNELCGKLTDHREAIVAIAYVSIPLYQATHNGSDNGGRAFRWCRKIPSE